MEKPVIVAREEFVTNFWNLVGQSGLPAFVLADVINVCQKELAEAAKQEYENAAEQYRSALVAEEYAKKMAAFKEPEVEENEDDAETQDIIKAADEK